MRSLIQAAAYNARFAFDDKEDRTYEEVIAPLRELMGKNSKFAWDSRREEAYQKLMRMMSSDTTLRPYCPDKPTHYVSDASPKGIAVSLYQEEPDRSWVLVDHVSRSLSKEEMRWKSQIDWESVAKSWGMEQFRFYLIGTQYTSWGEGATFQHLQQQQQGSFGENQQATKEGPRPLFYRQVHARENHSM